MTATTWDQIKPHNPDGLGGCLLLGKKDVAKLLGFSVSTIQRLRKNDPNFPRPVDLPSKIKIWKAADIIKYVETMGYQTNDFDIDDEDDYLDD